MFFWPSLDFRSVMKVIVYSLLRIPLSLDIYVYRITFFLFGPLELPFRLGDLLEPGFHDICKIWKSFGQTVTFLMFVNMCMLPFSKHMY